MFAFLKSINWTDPKIVVAVITVVGGGIFSILQLLPEGSGKSPPPSVTQTANPHIEVSPRFEANPEIKPVFQNVQGLDEEKTSELLEAKLKPLLAMLEQLLETQAGMQPTRMSGDHSEIKPMALIEHKATSTEKIPIPQSGDPLEIKAVELYNEGIDLLINRDWDSAALKLDAAIDLKPDFVEAYTNRVVALWNNGDIEGGIAVVEQFIQLAADAYRKHALALVFKERDAEALGSLRRAIELDPSKREWAKEDPAFDRLRDDPEFQRLVEGE
jgi:tetratricopeptide (TPR) repeat protein